MDGVLRLRQDRLNLILGAGHAREVGCGSARVDRVGGPWPTHPVPASSLRVPVRVAIALADRDETRVTRQPSPPQTGVVTAHHTVARPSQGRRALRSMTPRHGVDYPGVK